MVMTVGAFFQALRPWAEAPGVPATWTWTDLTQKFMDFICWFDQQNVGMGIISKSGDHGFYGYTGDCWSLSTFFWRRWHLAAEGFLVDAPGNQYGDGYFEGSMDDVVGLYIYILGYALCEWWSFDNNLHNQTFLPRNMRGNIVMSSVMEADDNNYGSRRLGGNQVG